MPEPKATPKQIAYLEFLGFKDAGTYSKADASQRISDLHDSADEGRLNSKTDELMRDWGYMRFHLHPQLYRREMVEHVLYSEDTYRSYVRSRVVGASEKLTKARVEKVIQALFDEDELLWWDKNDSSERFFIKLGEMFPGCVDGLPPSKREQKKALKAIPPIPRNQSKRQYVSTKKKKGSPIKSGCLILLALFVVFAVVSSLRDSPDDVKESPSTTSPRSSKPKEAPTKGSKKESPSEPKVSKPKEQPVKAPLSHSVEIPTSVRKWKSVDEREVLARVTELDASAETVTLRLADGQEFLNYSIRKFSREDQIFLLGREASKESEN